jgi:hypothetical protein
LRGRLTVRIAVEDNAVQKLLSLLDKGLEESRRARLEGHNIDYKTWLSQHERVRKVSTSKQNDIDSSVAVTSIFHSYRQSIAPFRRMWGYARLREMVVWIGGTTGERF